jgi:aspartyl-tRNA(Asn)/glutamyl-tRNA(Gln) amidotransferase subunit A
MSPADPWCALERVLVPEVIGVPGEFGSVAGDVQEPGGADGTEGVVEREASWSRPPSTEGWTLGVKANLEVAGIPTSAGTQVGGEPAQRDAEAVARLRAAGMVIAATTTLAEAAIGSVTANPWTGVCVNPHDSSFHAGGSSGGSAAAVAGGLVRVALGTDTMGSVRIPAACCGLVGWKPTRGAVPTQGLVPLAEALDTVGVLASNAVDALVVAHHLLDLPWDAVHAAIDRPQRVARLHLPVAIDTAAAQAADAVLRHLSGALGSSRSGAANPQVADVRLDLDASLVRRRGLLLCEAEAYAFWRDAVERDDAGLSEPLKALLRYGRDASDERIAQARRVVDDVAEAAMALFGEADVLVLPTLPGAPPHVGEDPAGLADLTAWVNLAGLPAVSVPTWVAPDGEPVPRSVQLIGRPGSDLDLLALAATLTP